MEYSGPGFICQAEISAHSQSLFIEPFPGFDPSLHLLKSSAKRLIEIAAGFEGKTVSHFIMASALERAERTFQELDMMTLNARNSRAFYDALADPVCFNRNLTAVFDDHDAQVISK